MFRDEKMISSASLQIYEYAIHIQDQMQLLDRVLPYYVMSYIQSGRALLRVNGREYAQNQHNVIIIPPNIKHDHIKIGNDKTVFFWWHFDCKVFDTVDLLHLIGMPVMFPLDSSRAFETAFSEYLDIMGQRISLKNMLLRKAKALEVMAYLFDSAEKFGGLQAYPVVAEPFPDIIRLILSSAETRLTLSDLAARYNLNATYLSNRFKAYFGISPIMLHRKLQIEQARHLLGSLNLPVAEVANRLGYKNPSAFSRFFTQKTGVAPSLVEADKARMGGDVY